MPCRRALLLLLPGAMLAACGFTPLHPTGRGRAIAVDPVDGPAGFALRERLVERIGTPDVPAYRLAVALDLREEGAAVTREAITTRYVVLGSATFTLVPVGGAEPILAETVTARTAYSTPASDTATIFSARAAGLAARERLARVLADRIALRLGIAEAAGVG